MCSPRTRMKKMETNLECHAVPKSQLSNKRTLLCFMTSLSTLLWEDETVQGEFPTPFSPHWSLSALYLLTASTNSRLAALNNGRRACVEIPNLWSLLHRVVDISSADGTDWPISSFRVTNWDGWINPTSSLDLNAKEMSNDTTYMKNL